MSNTQLPFRKNKLAIAMSMALLGTAISGCSSDSDNDSGDTTVSITIKANGGLSGNSQGTQGGSNGGINVDNEGGKGGVEIRKTGSAATSFTPPSIPSTVSLGDRPLTISSDTTLDTPVLYTVVTDATGTLATDQLYVGTDSILRISVAGGAADYANDTRVADGSYYRSSIEPNELFQAIGDDTTADYAPAGTYYLRTNSSNIYIAGGDGGEIADLTVTGLTVNSGATLTVSDNNGCGSRLYVNEDIVNSGTIKPETNDCTLSVMSGNVYHGTGTITVAGTVDDNDSGSIYLEGNQGINNSGTLNATGYTSTDADGGDGGEITMYANAYIVNSGEIIAYGGDGLNIGGSNNDGVSIYSPAYLENSSIINTNGGNSTGTGTDQDSGGDAGYIYLEADVVVNNTSSATITANGGNGTNGGSGGEIDFYTGDGLGALINASDIDANGGQGSTSNGGNGGSVEFYVSYSEANISNSGNLSATGGSTEDSTSDGGFGGSIYFNIYNYFNQNATTGDIEVSGNLNVSGGDATESGSGEGGGAGDIELSTDTYYSDQGDGRIALLGYDLIEANGGDGANGGTADNNDIGVYTDVMRHSNGEDFGGPIVNEVPMTALGGNTTATGSSYGYGGEGGYIYLEAGTDGTTPDNTGITVTNSASITVNGGTAHDAVNEGATGGNAGGVYIAGYHGANNSSSITANSGTGGEDSSYGGSIEIWTEEGPVNNTATLTANGSDSTVNGSHGGYIYMYGTEVTNSAALSVNGGNATATTSYGGDGGLIELYTFDGFFGLNNTGSLSYSFGTGVTDDGTEGCAVLNFINQGECNFLK